MLNELLYDWQKAIVHEAVKNNDYGLFLDCGLGKTVVSFAVAERWTSQKVIVVTLAPKAAEADDIDGSWGFWARRYMTSGLSTTRRDKHFTSTADCYITNYESLFDHKKSELALEPHLYEFAKSCKGCITTVIFDESHKLKEASSKASRAAKILRKTLKSLASETHLLLLSGTPFTRGYEDLRNQLDFLGQYISKGDFLSRYCIQPKFGEDGYVYSLPSHAAQPIIGYKNVDELMDLVHHKAVTMMSSDVVKLPEQIFNIHTVNNIYDLNLFLRKTITISEFSSENHRREMMNLPTISINDVSLTDGKKKVINPWAYNFAAPSDDFAALTAAQVHLRARELMAGFQGNAEKAIYFSASRYIVLENILQQYLNQAAQYGRESNIVLFYNFVPEYVAIRALCEQMISDTPEKEKWNIDVFNGSEKDLTHYNQFTKNHKATHNIILSNFASGSTGMNWQAYHHCIIFSLPIYRDWAQGLKRLHRLGQTHNVIYDILLGNNWLEEKMYNAIKDHVDYNEILFFKDLEANTNDN